MDSEALATFVTIYRAGGVSRAARRLGRSQPAISRRIALLEATVGAPLFERVTGGVALSQVGEALLPHAERVLAALQDAAAALGDLEAGRAGAIALAVVGTLANPALTKTLKRFRRAHPRVTVTLQTATSVEVSNAVRRGEAVIGIRYFDDDSPELVSRALAPEALVVACAPAHRAAGKRVRALQALKGERWLAFPERRETSAANIAAQFLTRGISDFAWTPVDSLSAQKCLVESGFGIALLPESSIREEVLRRSIATIRVGDLHVANPVTAVVRRGGYLSAPSRALLELLVTPPSAA